MRRLRGSPSGSGCTRHDGAPQAERAGNEAIQRGQRTRQIDCQRAAHVDSHDVVAASSGSHLLRGQHAAGRAGEQQVDVCRARLRGRRRPAMGLDEIKRCGRPSLPCPRQKAGHLGLDDRHQQHVEHDCGGALELADLGRHLVRA